MARKVACCVAALMMWGLLEVQGRAQDQVLAEMYGQGVHAFFAGQNDVAVKAFTTAIEQNAGDPRCYYFRGLCYSQSGRPEEAKADYVKGAELEMANSDRIYPVSLALQRIQGPQRVELEKFRQEARFAARLRELKAKKERYEAMQRAEQEVLRKPGSTRPAEGSPPKAALPADAPDPFSSNEAVKMEKAAPKPKSVVAVPPPAAKVAAPAEAPPAVAPKAEDPFGTPAATSKPAAASKPASASKPAAAKPPEKDPFATDPFATPETKPAAAQPGTKVVPPTPKPTASDPFGEDSPVPAKLPAEKPPAAAPANAGAAKAKAAPDATDPFGTDTPVVPPPQPAAKPAAKTGGAGDAKPAPK